MSARTKRTRWAMAAAGAGMAISYFFDPQMGRARRAKAKDRIGALLRRTGRVAGRRGRWLEGKAYGTWWKATHPTEQPKDLDDVTLAHKIESEVISRMDVPKGKIAVNVEDGVASLRGQVETPDQMTSVAQDVLRVPGVIGVENFLHLPGELPPNKARAMRASAMAKSTG
jgi:BON domain